VTTLPDARLTVTTVRADSAPAFVELLNAEAPLLWRRKGAGLVGHGEALRLTFSGANRMEDAARAWQQIVAQANVSDSVSIPGTGLVALASFAFADAVERTVDRFDNKPSDKVRYSFTAKEHNAICRFFDQFGAVHAAIPFDAWEISWNLAANHFGFKEFFTLNHLKNKAL
jgi:hypothetical protein